MSPIVDKPKITKVCVDDFALKKRYTYGTVMVDWETHRIIDLIPSRDTKEVGEWLKTYTLLKMSEVLEVPTDYIMVGRCEDTGTEEINLLIGRFSPKHIASVEKLLAIVYEMSGDD